MFSGLKECNADPEERNKVLEMIKRAEGETEQNSSESSDEDDLEERLGGLDLDRDADKIWDRLTDKVLVFIFMVKIEFF